MVKNITKIYFQDLLVNLHRPSDQEVNLMPPVQGKSPSVQGKERFGNSDMVTCRLSSCHPDCTKYICR